MNLQITSPYKPCPYKCKYCVSNFEGNYPFYNLYESDKQQYLKSLKDTLESKMFSGAVLTGMTEPTLFPKWIADVLTTLSKFNLHEVVLQTSNYNYKNTMGLSVLAYSIGDRVNIDALPYAANVSPYTIIRYNMMLSKDLTFEDILKIIKTRHEGSYTQFTVKYLSSTSNGHTETDRWIADNRIELSPKEIARLYRMNVWVDFDCMNAEPRYRVFRENGELYNNWWDF